MTTTAIVTSVSMLPADRDRLEAVMRARGIKTRSAYLRACIEADWLDLQQEVAVERHNARVRRLNRLNGRPRPEPRRKAPTPRKSK